MDYQALINGYFENTLTESQREELDRLIQTDTKFAADFEFQSALQHALKKEERRKIKSLFADLETESTAEVQVEEPTHDKTRSAIGTGTAFSSKETESKKAETKVISIRPWLVAASVALLLGLGSWFLFFNTPYLNTEQLYVANFAPYENVVHPIERGEQLEDLKTKAFTAYEDANYSLALELFKELQAQQADPYISFYEAIVMMQLNKHQEAIPLLKSYIENEGQLKDRAIWYLALAHLKQDNTAESKLQLKKLVQLNGFKSNDAKNLLEVLD